MNITGVTVSIIKVINKPPLHLLEQVAIIKDGEGTLEHALQGGELAISIHLDKGKETPKYSLHDGESVFVTGTVSGSPVSYPGVLTTKAAKRDDWKFVGRFGSPD